LQTLAPRSFNLGIGTGTFGTTLTVSAAGRDVIDRHTILAAFSIDFTRAIPQGSVTYLYDRLPATLRIDAFHQVVPRKVEASLELEPILETLNGASTGVTYDLPRDFSIHELAASYSFQRYDQELDFTRKLDPYAPLPPKLEQGDLGVVHAGYAYSSAESTNYSTGSEKGFTVGVGADYASGATASTSTLYSVLARSTGYVLLPWLRHNVLAVGASVGTSGGSYPRRGPFFTGGFVDQGPFQPFISNVRQGAFVLRGYEPAQFSGSSFALMNAEYRFPFWYADRGVSTLPIYLRKMSGVFFADYGGAFNAYDPTSPSSALHLGMGTEVWFDFVLGYVARANLRIGYAKGTDAVAPPAQLYFVAASAF
jgi:outer membrane protein assembly factor BamA